MKRKQDILKAIIAWVAVVALFISVKPDRLPIVLLIVPFILLFWAIYTTSVVLGAIYWRARGRSPQEPSVRRVAVSVSAWVVLLLIIQSIGQLALRDVLTFALIFIVGYFYIARWRRNKSS